MSKQSVKKRFDLVGKKFQNKLFNARPIHPPLVDLSIMSDASDLAWGAHLESVKIQGFREVISFLGT